MVYEVVCGCKADRLAACSKESCFQLKMVFKLMLGKVEWQLCSGRISNRWLSFCL
jgi:hypothetical protein